MSAGKAIIASKNGGMKEMLSDVNGGILIDPLKPREIANAIFTLLKSPSIRIKMGIENRKKIKSFSQEIIEKVENYYTETISNLNYN
jgi:glycosyltransferase involved in cell wall biosynthesis